MKTFTYRPKGVCSQLYTFEMDKDIIKSVQILGGCPGNLEGISRIIKNKTIDEVVEAFEGVHCGRRPTSCPDQIAKALIEYKNSL